MTNQEFLTATDWSKDLVRCLVSVLTGGMAARGGSVLSQILGAVAGGLGIFAGTLTHFFVYPIWEELAN